MSDLPPPDDDTLIADDKLTGIREIAKFTGNTERRAAYLIKKGLLPVGKEGKIHVGSKRRLLANHLQRTAGQTA